MLTKICSWKPLIYPSTYGGCLADFAVFSLFWNPLCLPYQLIFPQSAKYGYSSLRHFAVGTTNLPENAWPFEWFDWALRLHSCLQYPTSKVWRNTARCRSIRSTFSPPYCCLLTATPRNSWNISLAYVNLQEVYSNFNVSPLYSLSSLVISYGCRVVNAWLALVVVCHHHAPVNPREVIEIQDRKGSMSRRLSKSGCGNFNIRLCCAGQWTPFPQTYLGFGALLGLNRLPFLGYATTEWHTSGPLLLPLLEMSMS